MDAVVIPGADDAHVFVDRFGVQEGLLENQAHMGTQMAAVDLPDVHAADGDFAISGLIEPLEQVHHGGFAAARAAQNRSCPARRNGKADVMEDGHAVIRIGEGHMVKDDIAMEIGLEGMGLLRFRILVEDLLDAAHGHHGLAGVAQRTPQGADRPEQHIDIAGKDDQFAHGDFPPAGVNDADQQRHHALGHGDQVAAAPVDGSQAVQRQPAGPQRFVFGVELFHLTLLLAKGTHHPHAGEILLERGGHGALRFIGLLEGLVHHLEKPGGKDEQRRHEDHGDEGDLHIALEQDGQGDDDHQHRIDHLHDLHGEEAADGIHIGGAALDEVAGLGLDMVGEGQALQVGIEAFAQGLGNVLAGHGRQTALHVGEHAVDHIEHHEGQAQNPEVLSEEFPPAQRPDGLEDERGQGGGSIPQDGINGFRQHQRGDEADHDDHHRGDHGTEVGRPVRAQKREHGGNGFLFCFFLLHGKSPFPPSKGINEGRSGLAASAFACRTGHGTMCRYIKKHRAIVIRRPVLHIKRPGRWRNIPLPQAHKGRRSRHIHGIDCCIIHHGHGYGLLSAKFLFVLATRV